MIEIFFISLPPDWIVACCIFSLYTLFVKKKKKKKKIRLTYHVMQCWNYSIFDDINSNVCLWQLLTENITKLSPYSLAMIYSFANVNEKFRYNNINPPILYFFFCVTHIACFFLFAFMISPCTAFIHSYIHNFLRFLIRSASCSNIRTTMNDSKANVCKYACEHMKPALN